MSALATIQDLTDIWRPLTIADDTVALDRLLAKASAMLRQQAPHIDARIAAFVVNPATPGALDPLIAAQVVAEVVKRFLVNPEGVSTTSQTVGPYAVSKSFVDRYEGVDGSAGIRGGLQITASDLKNIRPAVTARRIGSFRVRAGMAPVRRVLFDGALVTTESDEILNADPDSVPFGAPFDSNA